MATRKSAKVSSGTASLNIKVGSRKSKSNKVFKTIKKTLSVTDIIVCFILLIVSLAIGIGAFFIVSKNDCFVLNGQSEITVEMVENSESPSGFIGEFNDIYKVKIIEFGKDISSKAVMSTNMLVQNGDSYKVQEVGTYYISYKVDSIKYGKLFTIEKIRLINFVEPSEDIIEEGVGA